MIQTYAIYMGTPLLCAIFARQAARKENKRYVWAIILLLSLVSGFRSFRTGLDTYSYVKKYALIAKGRPELAYGLESTFKVICFALSKISADGTFFLLTFALLTNMLIILRFWDFRKVSSFPWMVLCYYGLFYFMTMNGVRQFCAVAIVFYGTRYLDQGSTVKFVLSIALASMFHQTAIIGLVFLGERIFQWRQLSRRERILMVCCVAAIPFAMTYILMVGARYERYLSGRTANIGIMIPIKIAFFIFSLLFAHQNYRRQLRQPQERTASFAVGPAVIPNVCFTYAIGIMLTGMGYFYTQMDRIGWYFYLYEGIYYGVLQKDTNAGNRRILGLFAAFLVGYAFFISILHNSQGQVPYLFFWQ